VTRAQVTAICRGAYGLALLAAPHALVSRTGAGASPGQCRVARVLGARQLVQAAMTWSGRPDALAIGAMTDAVHGTSMVVLAAASPRLRRAALTEVATAAVFGAAGMSSAAPLPPGRSL
jgi:hypothetical protein